MKEHVGQHNRRTERGLPLGYLILVTGQTISVLGSQVTLLALPLTAITLLGAGSVQTGLLLACGRAPYLVLGLLAGVIVDRFPHRLILMTANLTMSAVLATIPVAALTGQLGMAHLYAANILVGVAAVIADVAYLACVPTVVESAQRVRAQSAIELSQSAAVALGPLLAGWLISALSAPVAIFLDAATFLVAALLLPLVPLGSAHSPPENSKVRKEIIEGLRFVFGHGTLRAVTLATCTFVFCYNAYSAVFLLYLTRNLGFTPGMTGAVVAIGAVGGIAGAIISSPAGRMFTLRTMLTTALLVSALGAATAPVIAAPQWAALICVAISQFVLWTGQQAYNVQQVPIRYAVAPQALQGRVNASIRTVVWGLAPLGALLGGICGDVLGLRATLLVTGLLGATAILWIRWSPLGSTTVREHQDLRSS